MLRRNLFVLTTIGTVALVLLSGNAMAQQKSLREQLAGAWTLVSDEATPTKGGKRETFGANPKGILILDAGGTYAMVQGRPDRPKFKNATSLRLGATAEEFAAAAGGFAANFGTWSVDEADKVLTRKYAIALIPNNDTDERKASVSIAGDELTLAGMGANGARIETVYRRAK